jgi:hypothetical protein
MTENTSMNAPQKSGKKRRRRAFGTVKRLPSGRFRARVPDLDGRYVSAPVTFATKTEAAVWVDLQRAALASVAGGGAGRPRRGL